MKDDRTTGELKAQELDLAREVRGLREDLQAYRVATEAKMRRRHLTTWAVAVTALLALLAAGVVVVIDVRHDSRQAELILEQAVARTCQEVRELESVLVTILEQTRDRRPGETDAEFGRRMDRLDRAVQLLTTDPCPTAELVHQEEPST